MSQAYTTDRPSYRAQPEPDGGTRMLLLAAAGLGGLLLLGMAGYALMGRPPAVVPVIEADSRPLRVKPDNPGGMQVAGADEAANDGRAVQGMAPLAESPAPQALRAQVGLPVRPVAPPAPALAPALTPAQVPVVPSPPAPATVAVATVAAATAPRPTSKVMVQLAALDTEAAGRAEWARLSQKIPDLLARRSPVLQQAERDGKPVWRVRTGGFTDTAEATRFCAELRTKGAGCTLAF